MGTWPGQRHGLLEQLRRVSWPLRGRPHSPEMSKGCPRAERVGQAEETSLPFEAPENQKSEMEVSEVEKETLSGELLPAASSMGSSS